MESWKSFIDEDGEFALSAYLYRMINDLKKQSLDMGTLLSDKDGKLRAFREQTKKNFHNAWMDLAEGLEQA